MKKLLTFAGLLLASFFLAACSLTITPHRYVVEWGLSTYGSNESSLFELSSVEEVDDGVWLYFTWTNSYDTAQEAPSTEKLMSWILLNRYGEEPVREIRIGENLEVRDPPGLKHGFTNPPEARGIYPLTRQEGESFLFGVFIEEAELQEGAHGTIYGHFSRGPVPTAYIMPVIITFSVEMR